MLIGSLHIATNNLTAETSMSMWICRFRPGAHGCEKLMMNSSSTLPLHGLFDMHSQAYKSLMQREDYLKVADEMRRYDIATVYIHVCVCVCWNVGQACTVLETGPP